MTEKLKARWEKIKGQLKKISKKVYIIAASILVLLIAAIIIVLCNRPYAVLFTGLNATETSAILTYLDGQGIADYKVENNDTILVPKHQEAGLKARLLMEGYPQSGFSYSTYYDNVGALSTESERNTVYLHDLQDRMSAVVRCFDNVKDAVVTIAQGEDQSYILDSNHAVEASASVLVTMQAGAKLSNEQAAAIRNYVAHAVQGLEIDKVDISDTMGNRYSSGMEGTSDAESSALKIRLEEEWENKIRTNVMQVLVPFYGEENVRVGVSVTVDVSQRTVNSRDVFLPEFAQDGSTNGEGIVGSRIYEYYVTREDDETVGGLVGSETNSDIPEYVEDLADPDGTEVDLGGAGETVFDNPYTETVALYTAGYLTDCTISVSINSREAGEVNVQNIREHVARAAGIRGVVDQATGVEYLEDQISVVSMPFYEAPVVIPGYELPVPMWVIYAAAGGLLLFIVLLIILLRIRRKRKKKKQEEQKLRDVSEFLAAAVQAQAPASGADVMSLQTEKSMELRKDIRQFAEDNPEIAAQMIRGWLRGGEDNG